MHDHSRIGRPPVRKLPRRNFDDLHVEPFTDGRGQQIAAALWRKPLYCIVFGGKVGGDEHAEVVGDRQEYSRCFRVGDLHRIAIAEVRDDMAPRRPEIDEDNIAGQRPVARGGDRERGTDRAVHAVCGNQIVGTDRLALPGRPVRDASSDTGLVHVEGDELRSVTHLAAAGAGRAQQDRLRLALWAILRDRFRAQRVQAGEYRIHVDRRTFLGAVERRLCQHGRNVLGHRTGLIAHSETTQDLQAAEAQVASLRIGKCLVPLVDEQRADTVLGQ